MERGRYNWALFAAHQAVEKANLLREDAASSRPL